MPSSETQRVRFNPISRIAQVASFTPVPTSDPQLYRDEPDLDDNYDADVESPDGFTQSQPFPKTQRKRHRSEASPRRATHLDSAMAVETTDNDRRRHSSETSEKHIVRRTERKRISALSYQNADLCAQIQVMCAVISIIIELMLIIHFSLPHHFVGLGFVAGILYLLGGALGLTSAHNKQYKATVLCLIMSVLSVIMALYVAVGAINGLVIMNQTRTEPPAPPLFEDDLHNLADGSLDYGDGEMGGAGAPVAPDYAPLDYEDHEDFAPVDDEEPYVVDDGTSSISTPDTAESTIYRLLYGIMIAVSALEMVFATAQAVICCSATCCKKHCFRRKDHAMTVIYEGSQQEKRETDKLVSRDVLERGDSTEFQDSNYHSDDECHIDMSCDVIYVIPGVHLSDHATEDSCRAYEEYEVDKKGKKKKKKKEDT